MSMLFIDLEPQGYWVLSRVLGERGVEIAKGSSRVVPTKRQRILCFLARTPNLARSRLA